MAASLLILRPEPGSRETLAKAQQAGFRAIAAPLFTVGPSEWQAAPASEHDALVFTSANAVRHAGLALATLATLPVYAVGKATADAARAAGLIVAHVGSSDAAALLTEMHAAGISRPLHLAGREHRAAIVPGVAVTQRIVYASEAVAILPDAAARALDVGSIALLHSPRAAETLASLLDRPRAQVAIAALSAAVADAAGPGWGAIATAATPDDRALLAAAATLCDGRRNTAKGQA